MEGLGVPKDYVQAYMWLSLTNFDPNPNLSHARGQMTPAQVFEAERMAEEWKVIITTREAQTRRLDRRRIWSHRFRRWRTRGWLQLPG